MNNKTSLFTEKENVKNYLDNFVKPKCKVYHIDDCYITQEIKRINGKEKAETLNKLTKGNFINKVKEKAELYYGDVPMMTYEEYLKELKDSLIEYPETAKEHLSRMWLNDVTGLEIGTIIVTNKEPGKATLINEVYSNNKLEYCAEYDLEEMIKIYEENIKCDR